MKAKKFRGFYSRVPGTCGVGLVSNFQYQFINPQSYETLPNNLVSNGIGYTIAGFVDSPGCKKVYKHIKDKYTIVFQSPVKTNENTGREFFFIIFKE